MNMEHHEHREHHHEHGPVNVHVHEGAVAVSFRKDTPLDGGKVEEILSSAMLRLRDRVREKGGMVGHIKAAVSRADSVTMLSLTGKDVESRTEDSGITAVSFAAIILGVDEEELEEMAEHIYGLI